MSKNEQYQQLLRMKRNYIIRTLVIFFFSVFMTSWLDWLAIALYAVYCYIELFVFLSKDICPFCKQTFFIRGVGV